MSAQDALQALESASQPSALDTLEQAAGPATVPQKAAPVPLSAGQRFEQGLMDLPAGAAQLVEHTPGLNTVANGWRMIIQQGLKATGHPDAASLFSPVSTGEFDNIIKTRENDYQAARQAAGQTGIDWWRLGGNLADPLNYLGGGGAAESIGGRIAQAGMQGAAINMLQPTANSPDSFWWDKVKSGLGGFLTGGAGAGVIEAATPALKLGIRAVKKVMGSQASAATGAAETVVNDALKAKGIDPGQVNLNLVSGMKQEVQSALEHGADVSPEAIVNRTKAESLPIPVSLMRGQATGDPMLFAREQNLKGIAGVGEPITQRLQGQNQAFIANLDALGAKDAPDSNSMGVMMHQALQNHWNQLDAQKNALYDTVRNSQGLSAKLNAPAIGAEIRSTLGAPEALHAWTTLPGHIQSTIYDLEEGKLPLTVSNLQALDRSWSADQRAAQGTTAHAIGVARQILNNATIDDDVGQEAMQASKMARQAHAYQMSLIEPDLPNGRPNPNFQPLLKAVVMDGKTPDKLFGMGFMNAAPVTAKSNLQFMSQIDPAFNQAIGKTFMGEIKRQALSDASMERGDISNRVLTGWARDPVKSARMAEIMPEPATQTFRNLADVVETAKKPPVASVINYSGTAPTMWNLAASAAKSSAAVQIISRIPGIHGAFVQPLVEGARAAKIGSEVEQALKPGVTIKSLMSTTRKQAARNRFLSKAVVPAAIAAESQSNKPE